MKYTAIVMAICMLMLSACTSKNKYGKCVGVVSDRDPALSYELSVWNTFLAIILFETIVVPIVVVANDAVCPVGFTPKKDK